MAMSHQGGGGGGGGGGLQDRLKEQVSASVREALERTTSILSNIHRVQSYLDILRTITTPTPTPSGGGGGGGSNDQGLRNAMMQVLWGDYVCEDQTSSFIFEVISLHHSFLKSFRTSSFIFEVILDFIIHF